MVRIAIAGAAGRIEFGLSSRRLLIILVILKLLLRQC